MTGFIIIFVIVVVAVKINFEVFVILLFHVDK